MSAEPSILSPQSPPRAHCQYSHLYAARSPSSASLIVPCRLFMSCTGATRIWQEGSQRESNIIVFCFVKPRLPCMRYGAELAMFASMA